MRKTLMEVAEECRGNPAPSPRPLTREETERKIELLRAMYIVLERNAYGLASTIAKQKKVLADLDEKKTVIEEQLLSLEASIHPVTKVPTRKKGTPRKKGQPSKNALLDELLTLSPEELDELQRHMQKG